MLRVTLAGFFVACSTAGPRRGSESSSAPSRAALPTHVVYVEANDPREGRNAVLAYTRADDGSLASLAGSPFATGGSGVGNPQQLFGPDDSDQEIVATPDRRLLFAVNSGSDTVAVFRVNADRTLEVVPGSPFPSGGENPVSLGVAGDHLVVVNKAQDPARPLPQRDPNYTVLTILPGGGLEPVPGSTVETRRGASPTQALVSPGAALIFGTDLLAPLLPEPSGALRSFRLVEGHLIPGPGTPVALPPDPDPARAPVALGLAAHPTLPLLYVGFPARQEVGVYEYDERGALRFLDVAESSGKAPCWLAIDARGTRLYSANTPDGSISTYDLGDPRKPKEIQKLELRDPGPSLVAAMGMTSVSSGPTQLAIAPDGANLYAVNQRLTIDPNVPEGNTLHALTVCEDGTLTEDLPDIALPVPPEARAQGLLVF
jgi:6-phosphogluconolactonase (cycloisomerase 2 family)